MLNTNKPVLALNSHWQPINVVKAKDAIVSVCAERGKIIDPITYALHTFLEWVEREITKRPGLTSSSLKFDVPEIVIMMGYEDVPDCRVSMTRRNFYIRDEYSCQYCGATPGTKELSIDHVVPRSRGGKTEWTNCVIACTECNRRKGARTPKGPE